MKNITSNYTFKIAVSEKHYNNKKDIKFQSFNKQNINVNEFDYLVKSGYNFCHYFTSNNQFTQVEKTINNFQCAQTIFIDIDNDNITNYKEFINNLKYTPSFAYTTYSSSDLNNRFRLIYFLENEVNKKQYEEIYTCVITQLEKDNNIINKDNCARSIAQMYYGNGSSNVDTWIGVKIYNYTDFDILPIRENKEVKKNNTKVIKDNKDSIKANINQAFINDLNSLQQSEFLEKYSNIYQCKEHTQLNYNDDGYCLLNDNYIEIIRRYNKDGSIHKWKNGEGRRKHLYIAALIYKKITPNITTENLLYNLVRERYIYYDNTDKQLSNMELIRIVLQAIKKATADIKLGVNDKKKKKKFIVSKQYCKKMGITPNQAKQIIKKKLNDKEIAKYYNNDLSIKENLEIMKNNNIKIGKSKLYQWKKEQEQKKKIK